MTSKGDQVTAGPAGERTCVGPGRVNLIGDHTDYNQGLALPMAIDLGVTVSYQPVPGDELVVTSAAYPAERAVFPVDLEAGAVATVEPAWARLVAAVVSLARPESGGRVHVTATLPRGAGLSSSAALAVALADAFGVEGDATVIARICREAEHRVGVPVGMMDPLVCAGGRAGHALLIDFATLATRQVPLPAAAAITVVDSGQRRDLATSAYGTRVAECEAAAAVIGPLGLATEDDIVGLRDPVLRRRARHVMDECTRVRAVAAALAEVDLVTAGRLMDESHASLASLFEATTPEVDALVARLRARPGVHGVRMTGAGFGGCVVALGEPGALDPRLLAADGLGATARRVAPSDGSVARRGGR